MARPWRERQVAARGQERRQVLLRRLRPPRRRRAHALLPGGERRRAWLDRRLRLPPSAEVRDSLRRFLLDLDAPRGQRGDARHRQLIGEVVQLYFAFNAPDTADGLATSTFRTYSWSAKRHLLGHEGASRGRRMPPAKYAVRLALEPAEGFNHAAAPRALRDAMRREAGRALSTCPCVASPVGRALLGGAVGVGARDSDQRLPVGQREGRQQAEVCARKAGRSASRATGEAIRSWALAPMAVELIRADMLARAVGARRPLIAYRDATLVSIQFGLGLRNQEVYGIRWSALDRERAHVVRVS